MAIPFVIAVAILLGLALFLFQEVRRSPGPMEWGRTPRWKKRVRVTLAVIPLLLSCIAFWAFLVEPILESTPPTKRCTKYHETPRTEFFVIFRDVSWIISFAQTNDATQVRGAV